jgi:hypothetical protein
VLLKKAIVHTFAMLGGVIYLYMLITSNGVNYPKLGFIPRCRFTHKLTGVFTHKVAKTGLNMVFSRGSESLSADQWAVVKIEAEVVVINL